jgi:hypothetical protein
MAYRRSVLVVLAFDGTVNNYTFVLVSSAADDFEAGCGKITSNE